MRRKTAAIVVIGNEILTGKSADKNAALLISQLYELGVSLRKIVIIPDDIEDIANSVRECSHKFDVVFTSGGVGPTHDDLTIEGVARAFNVDIITSPEVADLLRQAYGERLTEGHLLMSRIPHGARLVSSAKIPWPTVVMRNV